MIIPLQGILLRQHVVSAIQLFILIKTGYYLKNKNLYNLYV